ncbi:ubiquitin carboxyl-terminal hydrolase 27 isoform X2 [Andrographis paniculata]|uniref:ubiquitin carboxyl-terminal hydrolase 27 isoform X2 n=1 Tax=Andrographis paniculata TaxID=175694 RepID=UPI0021E821D5|nr:ubiquitin carboxyl-terminal hydrolase 27 isoform X2 [Andrographis paniculata]
MIIPSTKFSSSIWKPKNGSKMTWIVSPGLRFSVTVVALGAVGVLVIKAKHLIESNPLDQGTVSPRAWIVPGLENLGNNCFLNVVLQALSSCPSFWKYLLEMVEEHGSFSYDGDEDMPLVTSLASLVEELRTVRHGQTVLSPRKVMLAMDHYIPNFNLTKQQDAEEAFSHLLCSLREEISEHCVPVKSYLAQLPVLPNGRYVIRTQTDEESRWQKWKLTFLKPFDGILGSILVCQSCSFQISLEFQMFHTLHLAPPMSSDATIDGSTLDDCLKNHFAAERLENYCCSNCWHAAAIEYACSFSEKTDVETLQLCNKNDSCNCKSLPSLGAFPWLNRFSRTFKQLSVARSPKILCIHLQRASYDMFGQSVKLQGHVSFPLSFDLSSYVMSRVGLKSMDSNLQFGQLKLGSNNMRPLPYSVYQNMLNSKARNEANDCAETDPPEEQARRNAGTIGSGHCSKVSEPLPSLSDSRCCDDGKADSDRRLEPPRRSRPQMYRLVSVVEHFGSSGSGHYTVYRKVMGRVGEEGGAVGLLESAIEEWFRISDSEVYPVGEKDVLMANASMLFYEKVSK